LDAIINSFLLVFVSEMGDKTQLLALVLTLRYKKPWTIMAGIFVATLLNHALAAWGGEWVSQQISRQMLSWILGGIFIVFAGWILIPDKEGEVKETNRFGAFLTTTVAFFLAEMGDKTQLATIALGAQYASVTLVTVGTTFGMMASNALAIFFGDKLLAKIPMKTIRIIASVLFLIFGVAILIGY
jgi:putative Ca2+/H+ antiporter (TMEM165/GDT1 family)